MQNKLTFFFFARQQRVTGSHACCVRLSSGMVIRGGNSTLLCSPVPLRNYAHAASSSDTFMSPMQETSSPQVSSMQNLLGAGKGQMHV